ncbi:peptidoglycan/xylan/chitin deacetylase (PgdA/CDA1 family) [Sporomusaceae bacterium BoRhaA]|uniref:polysaccharide deacetylase family protein n=1 Tax=Pelorhabdus rhamnosifermentans TaxID=2772457 RepID=UPI001C062C1F|nr:polysaccharide deacetylase family protein [Pelorhabdus rhamnosifermentans]MBU2700347.1 peptidoglycan/xylan/chitin deacetylase (PgdA/CDA1 family) [Pelorhabdus rhamnosifermentans]
MMQHSAFKELCRLTLFFFLLFCTAPLGTFAYYSITTNNIESTTEKNAESPPNYAPAYLIMDYTNNWLMTDKPVYDPLLVSERKNQKLPTTLPPLTPYYGQKTVYLTFDDGPDPENTPIVLALLNEYQIHATFFLVGSQAEKYPDLIKQIFTAGHAIGNHSYNHNYKDLYRSPQTYLAQLHHTDEIIKQAIGVRPHISRAPGGSAGTFNKAYWNSLEQEGYCDVGWNISSGDASRGTAPQLVANIAEQIQNKALWSHATVLMHDGTGHGETVKALRQIIELFKSQGFEFRVVNFSTPSAW